MLLLLLYMIRPPRIADVSAPALQTKNRDMRRFDPSRFLFLRDEFPPKRAVLRSLDAGFFVVKILTLRIARQPCFFVARSFISALVREDFHFIL